MELPSDLDGLINLALRVDARLQRHDQRVRLMSLMSELSVLSAVPHPIMNPCRWKELGFPFLLRRRNARSMHSQFHSWGISSHPRECAWILIRLKLWWIGQPIQSGGFANFYRCFIRNFCQLASPLTALTSTKTFGRFNFTLSYRPGSKNIKSDALSRVFEHSERSSTPEYIISERLIVSTLIWEVESKVHTALEWVKPLPGCTPSRLFVLEGLRSDVIQWRHCSKLACHPGVNLTSFLVKQQFWWHSMGCGVQDFVFACSVCARGKTSNRPPDGLL